MNIEIKHLWLHKCPKKWNQYTLIALVITIIVLLILAGVSIAMLSGDNSILRNAQNARDRSAEGTLDESVKIAIANILTENLAWPDVTDESFDLEGEIAKVNPNIEDLNVDDSATDYFVVTGKINDQEQTTYVMKATGAVSKTQPQ